MVTPVELHLINFTAEHHLLSMDLAWPFIQKYPIP